ncbi:MAG: SDR family oxidoreductase [Hyphomicrobiales bacterium]
MRILLTGANGFIGAALSAALLNAGHTLVAAVRDPAKFRRRFPFAEALPLDLSLPLDTAEWTGRLRGVDALINCAGILQSGRGGTTERVHAEGPTRLFTAAHDAGVGKIIQISAVSVGADTAYAASKKQADDALAAMPLRWTILRPSLVYGTQAYGGTAMLRALAVFPYAIPVIGAGRQKVTPIHVDDLARVVLACLPPEAHAGEILTPCGPETITLSDFAQRYRAWFGLRRAPLLHVPVPLIRIAAKLGDWFGTGPLTTTSLKQLQFGNAAEGGDFSKTIGFNTRSMAQALQAQPAGTADLWHARLYLLRPLLRTALIIIWLVSGLLGLFSPADDVIAKFAGLNLPEVFGLAAGRVASLVDLALAAALLFNGMPRRVGQAQLSLIAAYTLALTVISPGLWLDLFGALLKNIAVFALVLVHMISAEER